MDANLVATNIKKDVPILGVTGTYEGSGGGGGSANAVVFYDYDGTVLHSYSASEANALTALPALPSHSGSGLTCQGWNFSLAQMKSTLQAMGTCQVGAIYTTSDGKTRAILTVRDPKFSTVKLTLTQSVVNSVSINWGDGSGATTWSGTSQTTLTHTYSPSSYPATYTIAITVNSGTLTLNRMNLADVTEESNNATTQLFAKTSMLKEVHLGSNIKIGDSAFLACQFLEHITIPSTITSVGQKAFNECSRLQSIIIPSSITVLSSYVFDNCYSLHIVSLPATMYELGTYAFRNCRSLATITLPYTISFIAGYIFYNCSALSSIVIPPNVKTIGTYAFYYCYGLVECRMSSVLTQIASYGFAYCYGLRSLVLPSTLSSLGAYAFQNCYALPINLQSLTQVSKLNNYTFFNCYAMKTCSIPSTVTSIGTYVFSGCRFETVTIPESITSISSNLFQACSALQSITFPSGITSIAAGAFNNCHGVRTFDFRKSSSVPTLGNVNAFVYTDSTKEIIVPDALYNTWKAASNWNSTTNNIVNCIVKASESSLGPLT